MQQCAMGFPNFHIEMLFKSLFRVLCLFQITIGMSVWAESLTTKLSLFTLTDCRLCTWLSYYCPKSEDPICPTRPSITSLSATMRHVPGNCLIYLSCNRRNGKLIASDSHRYWWRNLLLIHNLFDSDSLCANWSWSVACEMQFFTLFTLGFVLYAKWV